MALITLTGGNDTAPPPAIAAGDTVRGLGGNDTITAPSNTQVDGNEGDDVLTGGGTGVTLYGGQGSDKLTSVSSSILSGDKDKDTLTSVFADTMYGGIDNDSLIVAANSLAHGGQNDDVLLAVSGGANGATLAGDKGNDIIKGAGNGGAKLYGDDITLTLTGADAGKDTIWAYGQDTAYGGGADDSLVSFGGKVLLGNQGNDNLSIATTLSSGAGISLYGGQDDDTITGFKGGALLSGDKGNDSLVATGEGTTVDTLVGGAGADNLRGVTTSDQNEVLIGGADSIPGQDTTTGVDLIDGRGGADTIVAGGGGSTVSGAGGNDSIIGGKGNDSFLGGDDNDILIGGAGNDSLQGWRGKDTLTGGAGADSFLFVGGTFATSAFFTSADGISAIANNALNDLGINNDADSITDFQVGVDKILLDGQGTRFAGIGFTNNDALFAALSTSQIPGVGIVTSDAQITQVTGSLIYSLQSGKLWYDDNPAIGQGTQTHFLTLQPGLTNLSSQDFIIV